MAENKKGFVLYCDISAMISRLPDDIAGKLFKIILDYVNDKDPVVDDLLLEIAFEPIKQQLKRDLIKYNKFRERQAENGKQGGRPKKTDGLIENPENPSLFLETQKSLIDTVTVTDTVKDIVKEKVSKEERALLFTQRCKEENFQHQILEPPQLKLFIEYWTEAGENQKKIRAEFEKVFDIKKRLEKWSQNSVKFKQHDTSTKQQQQPVKQTRFDRFNELYHSIASKGFDSSQEQY